MMTSDSTEESIGSTRKAHVLSPQVVPAVRWFTEKVRASLTDNLLNLTVYGPAVTSIFDPSEHHVHHLIVLKRRDVDQLLNLATHSKQAARQRIAPPLIVTQQALLQSCDAFPLEWLDISQFHMTLWGDPVLLEVFPRPTDVRLQCERDLRSLDILLQRGILASGGKSNRINRLEDEASDSLIRVLRGIGWLNGDRDPLLPDDVCTRCEEVVGFSLPGCLEAIRVNGRHDIGTIRKMLDEIGRLADWINHYQAVAP